MGTGDEGVAMRIWFSEMIEFLEVWFLFDFNLFFELFDDTIKLKYLIFFNGIGVRNLFDL